MIYIRERAVGSLAVRPAVRRYFAVTTRNENASPPAAAMSKATLWAPAGTATGVPSSVSPRCERSTSSLWSANCRSVRACRPA